MLVFLFRAEVVSVERPLNRLQPGKGHCDDDEVGDNKDVDEKENEEFAVPESDAVVDPGAVMVHVEDAAVARRAVMAPFWLKDVAHEAVASALVLRVTQVEAPEDWNLSRVRRHRLNEGPNQHKEEEVEHAEEQDHSPVVCSQRSHNQSTPVG